MSADPYWRLMVAADPDRQRGMALQAAIDCARRAVGAITAASNGEPDSSRTAALAAARADLCAAQQLLERLTR